MKTLDTTTASNVTSSHARVRLVLALAGIIIAILCSVALVRDMRSAERLDASGQSLPGTKTVASHLLIKVMPWR
jgi:hypothetical protein